MNPSSGYLMLVLHAHLPFVRHPEHPEFLEEGWLFEAITETYIPLLRMFERLERDGVPFRLTMTLSPTLCEMLADPLLRQRYVERLDRMVDLCRQEGGRASGGPFEAVAKAHRTLYENARDTMGQAPGLLGRFRAIQDRGGLEIITCAATHAFLPHVARPEAVRAQIAVAVGNYKKHFGRQPRGIWLPECAYSPGLEGILAGFGLSHFFVEAHGILHGSRVAHSGVYAPIRTPAGPCAFGRDIESSRQVWSAREGYPGNPVYREFYRDVGYDADHAYIRPFLHSDGVRRSLGLKYHRITGSVPLDRKEPYDPAAAARQADADAGNFLFNRQNQIRWLRERLGRPPSVVCPYDAELFGHWWFEGPVFLESLFRRAAAVASELALITPAEWLRMAPDAQVAELSASTWGDKGYGEVWLNSANDWIYRHQHQAEERMVAMARRNLGATGIVRRALNQAARELLLLQASDWAFLMTVGTAVPYAHRRFKEHVVRFTRLADEVDRGMIDEGKLAEVESRDSIFQEIDFAVYA